MRRISRKAWWLSLTTAFLTALIGLLTSTAAGVFSHLSPWIALAIVLGAAILLGLLTYWLAQRQSTSDTPETLARENRPILLSRVQTKWITNFLENELYYDELLPLPLRIRTSRSSSSLQNPLDQTQVLPLGTTIKEVFDQARGRLLILGEAGTGKTTLLLELARCQRLRNVAPE